MWMTEYFKEAKCQLRDVYHFKPNGGTESDPTFASVPDGHYPMTIDGRIDHVQVIDGKFKFCNFNPTLTVEEQEAIVRKNRAQYLLVDAKRPGEPDIPVFGIKVSEMTLEELRATIYRMARSLQEIYPNYFPGLGKP